MRASLCGMNFHPLDEFFLRHDEPVSDFQCREIFFAHKLNDAGGENDLARYTENLGAIFDKTAAIGAECIFITENMMCSKVSCHLDDENLRKTAQKLASTQKSGLLKAYFEAAKNVAAAHNVKVCDIYSAWEKMSAHGVDTTELLANKLNHPIKQLHRYTALKLIETMFE